MANRNRPAFSLRDVIGEYLMELGERSERVVVVNADLSGTCRNRRFAERFPPRQFNVGIAEQNLVSFSAGLAHEGFLPYAFSMAPFLSMRACEQCRTDAAYARLPVRLMGTYAGVSGGISGATHWAMEDVAILSAIAGMTVCEPCDPVQAKRMLDASVSYPGVMYIRSTIERVPGIYGEDYAFELGKASVVTDGNDGAFLCSGITVPFALEAAGIVKAEMGARVRVVDLHTIKPLDDAAVLDAARTGCIVAAQDHSVCGGLGSMVAGVLAERGVSVQFQNVGIPDRFVPAAHAPYLYRKFGYDAGGLAKTMMELLTKSRKRTDARSSGNSGGGYNRSVVFPRSAIYNRAA